MGVAAFLSAVMDLAPPGDASATGHPPGDIDERGNEKIPGKEVVEAEEGSKKETKKEDAMEEDT